jgi:hypothetical protein
MLESNTFAANINNILRWLQRKNRRQPLARSFRASVAQLCPHPFLPLKGTAAPSLH